MIRTEREYKEALKRVKAEEASLEAHRVKLSGMGFTPAEVEKGMEALVAFHLAYVDEVQQYERIKSKNFSDFRVFDDVRRLLVGARIASGLSQRDLAKRLGVDESQISRDERNEYSGATIERASEVLEALGIRVGIDCQFAPDPACPDVNITHSPKKRAAVRKDMWHRPKTRGSHDKMGA